MNRWVSKFGLSASDSEARAVLISEEIEKGTFNYLKWFPDGNNAHLFRRKEEAKQTPQTIREYYEEWIADKIPPLVKKSRGRKYRSHFNAHILPLHGHVRLDEYSFSHIRDLRTNIVDKKKRSVKTARNVIDATLKAFFRDAKAEGKIDKNPFNDIPPKWWPPLDPEHPDPFTEEERDKIIQISLLLIEAPGRMLACSSTRYFGAA